MWTIRLHRRQFLTHRQTQASSQSFPQSGCTQSLPPSPVSDLLTNPTLPSPSLSSFCSCRKVDTAQLTHSQSIYLISSTHQVLITAGTGCSSGPPQMRAEFSTSMLGRLTSQPGEWSVTSGATSSLLRLSPAHHQISTLWEPWPRHQWGTGDWNFQDVSQSRWQR